MGKCLRFVIVLWISFTSRGQASPIYPWDREQCYLLRGSTGAKVGALCSDFDTQLQVGVVSVYYFGQLSTNKEKYAQFLASLKIEGSSFVTRRLSPLELGDGRNLPFKSVLHSLYVVTTHFSGRDSFPTNAHFELYFSAEKKKPDEGDHLDYDSLNGSNFHGQLRPLPL